MAEEKIEPAEVEGLMPAKMLDLYRARQVRCGFAPQM